MVFPFYLCIFAWVFIYRILCGTNRGIIIVHACYSLSASFLRLRLPFSQWVSELLSGSSLKTGQTFMPVYWQCCLLPPDHLPECILCFIHSIILFDCPCFLLLGSPCSIKYLHSYLGQALWVKPFSVLYLCLLK